MVSLPLLALLCTCAVETDAQFWRRQRDDLNEHRLDRSVDNVRNEFYCVMMAESKHQAVQFSPSDGTCRMWICQLGATGCRKCRNARNSSLPELLVRVLDTLGRSCWRTFQRRVDGSVDFYRNWTDYVSGFGQGEDRNFWMGLEAIHLLTQAGDRRVRWEMSMWNGSWWWWEDQVFSVQGADQGYRATIGAQDTSTSNVVEPPGATLSINNQMFSTFDKDQDSFGISCAVKYSSGWWHNACFYFNPNGLYYAPPTALELGAAWAKGLTFHTASGLYPFDYTYSMRTVECMVIDFAPDT